MENPEQNSGRIFAIFWGTSFCNFSHLPDFFVAKTKNRTRKCWSLQKPSNPLKAIPAGIYRSAQESGPMECFLSAFGYLARTAPKCFWALFEPQKVPKNTQKALQGALRAWYKQKQGKTKLSTSTIAGLFSKMALISQRIAMVDMVCWVLNHFHIYCRVDGARASLERLCFRALWMVVDIFSSLKKSIAKENQESRKNKGDLDPYIASCWAMYFCY